MHTVMPGDTSLIPSMTMLIGRSTCMSNKLLYFVIADIDLVCSNHTRHSHTIFNCDRYVYKQKHLSFTNA